MKLPSTSGGAAGSLVRGNEFYQNAPAPYSSTRRGQDTIHITPGHIKVTRPAGGRVLRPELLMSQRLDAQQLANAKDVIRNDSPAESPEVAHAEALLRSITLTELQSGQDVLADGLQPECWQYPGTYQIRGQLTYVGDDYFVCVAKRRVDGPVPTIAQIQALNNIGPRVALIHKDNLDGPYLNTRTRQLDPNGRSLWFHKPYKPGSDRGYNDRPSDILNDVFGVNYFLDDCRWLLQREWGGVGDVAHSIGVVPLGWLDKTHRYAFAVFGPSAAGWQNGEMGCFVYCTGTRSLISTSSVPRPQAQPYMAPAWAGAWHSDGWCSKMTAVGRGTMVTILKPLGRYESMPGVFHHTSPSLSTETAPMLVWSEDFGRTFQQRPLLEVRDVIARAVAADGVRFPQGGYCYPELRFEICAINEQGDFLLLIAALNEHPSGDAPSSAFDAAYNERLNEGREPPLSYRWWYAGDMERCTHATLFRGSVRSTSLMHLPALDVLQLRFGHPLVHQVQDRSDDRVPPGTYRYNILMNAALGSPTPVMQALSHNSAAIVVRTMEVTVSPGWTQGSLPRDHESYRVVETFVMHTVSQGSAWTKRSLPAEHVSHSDVPAYGAKVDPQHPQSHAAAPGLDFMSWCVIEPETFKRCPQIAVAVIQKDRADLYITKGRVSPWDLARHSRLSLEEPIPPQAANECWDYGATHAPGALIYLGDQGSEDYPDVLTPALPKLLK